jgi:predicted HicB family RNase H-like nuclease
MDVHINPAEKAMSKRIPPYPLRLDPEIRKRVEQDAAKKHWQLSTWLKQAVLLMLSVEESKEGRA